MVGIVYLQHSFVGVGIIANTRTRLEVSDSVRVRIVTNTRSVIIFTNSG